MSTIDQAESKSSKFKSFTDKSKKFGSSAAAKIKGSTQKVGSGLGQVIKDFKAFLDRGNVIDVAVALVMGAAFTDIVKSFVSDLFTPLVGLAMTKSLSYAFVAMKCPPGLEDQIMNNKTGGNKTMDDIIKSIKLGEPRVNCKNKELIQSYFTTPELANKAGVLTWNYGNFLDKCITLGITATILFFVVKAYTAAFRRNAPKPKEKDCPNCLKKVPLKATRCFECTSTLDPYVSEDEDEPEEKSFFGFAFKKKNSSEKIDKVV